MSKELTNAERQKNYVNAVQKTITGLVEEKRFTLPKNYVVGNALESAFYQLISTKDKTGKNLIEKSTKESVANALKQMCVLGLNPAKQQCYFIPYAGELQLQTSYLGEVAILKRITNLKSINANVIFKDDEFTIEIDKYGNQTFKHATKLENKDNDPIGAYCVITLDDGSIYSDYMTIKQIYQSWGQAKFSPFDEKGKLKKESTHGKFIEEMAKKTIIRRTCKMFLKSSSDTDLVIDTYCQVENKEYREVEREVEAELEEEVTETQATEELDIEEPKEDKLSNIAKEIQEKNKAKKKEEEKKEDECQDEPGF